jgi:hypothetical protein
MSRRHALRLFGAASIAAAAGSGTPAPALAARLVQGTLPTSANLAPWPVIKSDTTIIGMSAPARLWGARVRDVGPGLGARRIFADLSKGATNQIKLVERAHADGMLPVISYKVGGDPAGAALGRFDAVAEQAAANLASYDLATAVTVMHEPYGELDAALYAAASQRLLSIFRRGRLKVGPVLNGWLLDTKLTSFALFCPDELLELSDWFGIDTYESGTLALPGIAKPADRIGALSEYLTSRGYGGMPIGVPEYNGYSAQSIADVGEALFSTPDVWFGCLWNSTGDKGVPLAGDRLAAFQQTLADPRCTRITTAV